MRGGVNDDQFYAACARLLQKACQLGRGSGYAIKSSIFRAALVLVRGAALDVDKGGFQPPTRRADRHMDGGCRLATSAFLRLNSPYFHSGTGYNCKTQLYCYMAFSESVKRF